MSIIVNGQNKSWVDYLDVTLVPHRDRKVVVRINFHGN